MTSKTEPKHFIELPPELIQALGQCRYINRDWIAYPAQPYCPLSLHFLFNDNAQYQESYWPHSYPNSQPLCMRFL